MANFTDRAEQKVANAFFKGDALGQPSTWWLGILTTSMSDTKAATTGIEVSTAAGSGYARIACTTADFTSATTAGSVFLTTRKQFPDPLTNWSTAYALGLWDSSVTTGAGASTLWFWGNLATTVNISAGNPVAVSSGSGGLLISFD